MQRRNEELQREAAETKQVMLAFARGEVDAVTLDATATPVLLHAAQEKLLGSQRLLRAIFDGALEPMVLTDRHGRCSETVLLVEDEEQVRKVASTILRRNGYHVLEAASGADALLISKGFSGTIHLMLTDVVMPRMSGRQLAEQLATERPQTKVMFKPSFIIGHGLPPRAVQLPVIP